LSFFQFTSDSSLYTRELYLLKFNTLHLSPQTPIYRTDLPLPTNEIKKTLPKEKPPARADGQKCKTKANI
jgi:hypothetical protein